MTSTLGHGRFLTLAVAGALLSACQSSSSTSEETDAAAVTLQATVLSCGPAEGDTIIELVNESDSLAKAGLEVGLYDQGGNRVDYQNFYVSVPAGQTVRENAYEWSVEAVGATCKVDDVQMLS